MSEEMAKPYIPTKADGEKLASIDAGRSTQELAYEWVQAQRGEEVCSQRLAEAEARLADAQNRLGRRIDPGDQGIGEVLCCWVRFGNKSERMVVSHKTAETRYRLSTRGAERPSEGGMVAETVPEEPK